MDLAVAAAAVVFTWWLGTGLVLLVARLPAGATRRAVRSAVALAAVGFALLFGTASGTGVIAVCLGVLGAVLVWGAIETLYLQGLVTGPRKSPCPPDAGAARRFWLAVQTSLWHELAIVATGLVLIDQLWAGDNPYGLWTFMVLWLMRWSAKLNIFFGVANLHAEWLPEHLRYTTSYMGSARINAFFPLSVTAATVMAAWLAHGMVSNSPDGVSPASVGHCLAFTMLVLGILEHWFLVLPINDAALWRWAAPSDSVPPTAAGEPSA